MKVRYLRAAAAERDHAADWYEEQGERLGQRFLEALGHAVRRIEAAPNSFPVFPGEPRARRALLGIFPYAVVFVVRVDAVTIVAVAHSKRKPGYWTPRV